ncbi:hypothetical protein ACFE04_008473 [Oxalis oulophora]
MDGSDYYNDDNNNKDLPQTLNGTDENENEKSYEKMDPNLRDQRKPHIAEFDENEQNYDLPVDFDSKPYDPETNYLSPRPKFLRYKPTRRQEILLRKENESSSDISRSSSFESKKEFGEENALINALEVSTGNSKEEENEQEFDESDDEFEKIDEVRGWGLKGLFKFILVLVALVFSTSYVCSVNSHSPSFSAQAVRSLEDKYYFIQHNVYEFVKSFQDSSELVEPQREGLHILVAEQDRQIDRSDEVSEPVIQSREIDAVETDVLENKGDSDDLGEAVKQPAGKIDEVFDNIMSKSEETGESEAIEQPAAEIDQVFFDNMEINEENCEIGEVDGNQMAKNEETGDIETAVEKPSAEIDQFCDSKWAESGENYKIGQVCDSEKGKNEKMGDEIVIEKFESLQVSREVPIPEPTEIINSLETQQDIVKEPNQVINSVITDQADDHEIDRTEILNPDSEEENVIKLAGSESYNVKLAVIGASIFCAILAFIVLGLRFMKNKPVQKDSSKNVLKPCVKSVKTFEEKTKNPLEESSPVAESPVTEPGSQFSTELKFNSAQPHVEEDNKENFKSSDSFANSQPLVNALEKEDSSETYKSHAPAVEFLGEFSIGEVSSSMKSRAMKISRMVESEVGSHHSASVGKAQSMSYHLQPAVSESSNIASPSHGSFTAEKRTPKKKKENRDGDGAGGITTTPLRRSSRLHNRAIVSP